MKKILSSILICIMIFGMCACGTNEAANSNPTGEAAVDTTTTVETAPTSLQVGFGSGDITPNYPIGLQGFGNGSTRISTGFSTYIYVHCVAITDDNNETVLIMSLDSGNGKYESTIRPMIEQKFNIPQDHIIFSAIHQHSTPIGSTEYLALMSQGAEKAVQQALDDRAPATMYINKVTTKALSFVRNYVANDPAHSIVGDNYNDAIGNAYGYLGHESESDKEMRLIKFVREGDKKPIIMVNFQAHPHLGTSAKDTSIHADWPGIMRETVAEKLDAHCMYLGGAGGNLNSNSRIEKENMSTDWKHHGQRAANYVINAEESYTQVEAGSIKIKTVTNSYTTDHSMNHLLEEARLIDSLSASNFDKAKEEVNKYPEIHSVYHAQAIVEKAALDENYDLTIGAISIGDVVFTFHPYEMFDTNGMELRDGTVGNPNYEADEQMENPYEMTFICTLGNGHMGYVPSILSYRNGGYSTDIAYLAPGSGERLVCDYLAILNELHD